MDAHLSKASVRAKHCPEICRMDRSDPVKISEIAKTTIGSAMLIVAFLLKQAGLYRIGQADVAIYNSLFYSGALHIAQQNLGDCYLKTSLRQKCHFSRAVGFNSFPSGI